MRELPRDIGPRDASRGLPVMRLVAHVRGAERPATLDDRDVVALQPRLAQMVGQDA
jgi:hypothetical protein